MTRAHHCLSDVDSMHSFTFIALPVNRLQLKIDL